MLKVTGKAFFHGDFPSDLHMQMALETVDAVRRNFVDYYDKAREYGCAVHVRESGTWMTALEEDIEKRVVSIGFPVKESEIVICENDQFAESFWVAYLQNRFPGKSIETLNFFSQRSVEELKQNFENIKYITFSTTFTSYDWFNNLLEAQSGQELIGYCHVHDSWEKALEMVRKKGVEIEIVTDLNTE